MARTAVAVVTPGKTLERVPPELQDASLFESLPVCTGAEAVELLANRPIDLTVLNSDGSHSEELLGAARSIRQSHRKVPLVLITANSSESEAIAALRAGIDDYLRRPISPAEFSLAVRECIRRARARFEFHTTAPILSSAKVGGVEMVGPGKAMQEVRAYLAKLAMADVNVLITGETGTGKELAARMIHERSKRREKPLVNINCAAIPDSLLESELFGYERGSFTGAHKAAEGKLKAADGGTVFLDEIGDMSQYAQAKILRAIESGEIQRLGCSKGTPLNIRIIAATNRELESLVDKGDFRRDLYFRLNVARVHLPALWERKEDIPALLSHYLEQMNRRYGRQVRRFSEQALDCVLGHKWPGNVRELKNFIEAMFVDISSTEISVEDFPPSFRHRCQTEPADGDERSRLVHALLATNWNKSRAADKLHWSRMTLYRKIAKHNVQKEEQSSRGVSKRAAAASRIA